MSRPDVRKNVTRVRTLGAALSNIATATTVVNRAFFQTIEGAELRDVEADCIRAIDELREAINALQLLTYRDPSEVHG